ncbi:MAG: 23S rRNA (uracil-5-)-methyltransferase RumA [Deltaproteobacteria bacterium GWA2_54_12]|nr:MAG: 23S rRNA (uracil-5-)-methyltransferase RumA [Deltaproteobacteria bacterium GWA2_54_12]
MSSAVIEITSLAYGGKGLGRIDGKVVFVPFTAPGDVVEVEITVDKKGFSEGSVKRLITPSPLRVEPACGFYGRCGGCSLQHMSYAGQLEWKQRILDETLRRIGKVEGVEFEKPIASPRELHYRSRARFHVHGHKAGFFEAASHRVVDMDSCPLLDPLVNETFRDFKQAVLSVKGRPVVYSFEVGVSEDDGKTVVSILAAPSGGFDWGEFLKPVRHLKGFEVWVMKDRTRKGKFVRAEKDTNLVYTAGGVQFSAPISVFSQVNAAQNRAMVEKISEFAALSGKESVLDLYCGVGNLSLPAAKRAARVTGVESSGQAVKQAQANAQRNSIKNAVFHEGDAALWLKQNLKNLEQEGFDVLILDPPRGGEPQIAQSLSAVRPARIVYISCSPPTLSRDIHQLTGLGYIVSRAVLVDMFPQTYHIESILGLELRS